MESIETVPAQEIERRNINFQRELQEMGLDGAFILQNADLFYFSGTIQSSVLFIPQQGEAILMVQKGFERAGQESPLKHLVYVTGRGQIKKVLKDYGVLDLKKVGLEMDTLPVNQYSRCRQTFPECEWLDVSRAILRLRMIKTPYEVEQIRRAAQILHKGYMGIKDVSLLCRPLPSRFEEG